MTDREPRQQRVPPREIELPHHNYQPGKAELEEEIRTDKTFDEIASACLQSVNVTHAEPPKRERDM